MIVSPCRSGDRTGATIRRSASYITPRRPTPGSRRAHLRDWSSRPASRTSGSRGRGPCCCRRNHHRHHHHHSLSVASSCSAFGPSFLPQACRSSFVVVRLSVCYRASRSDGRRSNQRPLRGVATGVHDSFRCRGESATWSVTLSMVAPHQDERRPEAGMPERRSFEHPNLGFTQGSAGS